MALGQTLSNVALGQVRRFGAPVTFTRTTRTYAPATDTSTPADTTIAGHAMRVKGDPDTYRALGLIQASAPTLLFVPSTYGESPEVGDAVTWGGLEHTVKSVNPVAPDGNAILSRVVIAR